jgi:hypothetical protein
LSSLLVTTISAAGVTVETGNFTVLAQDEMRNANAKNGRSYNVYIIDIIQVICI